VGVLVGVTVTGALHEDGLADSADAIAGGTTPERRREILRDSRLGTYGTAALCGSLLLRVAAVTALLEAGWQATVGSLVAAHAVARVAGVALMAASPSADSGLGATFAAAVTSRRVVVTCGIGGAIGAVATGWWVVPFAAATAIVAVIVAVVGRRAFGRLNGDLYGAAEQLAEIAVVLIGSGLAAAHAVWWT
jgi:adenosylcobinamide-GDP ribazoletransferase